MSQDLSKGKIYKITNDYNDDVYVGSTCDTLVKRFSAHKNNKNSPEKMNRPLYALMREIGNDRFRIELIEDYSCEDKYQLRQREGYFIREIGTLNKRVECRTKEERYRENKDLILEKQKEYRKEHIEEYAARDKLYREEHKEEYKSNHQKYYLKNCEELKQKAMDYRKENHDIIKEQYHNSYLKRKDKLKEKIKCECGCEVTQSSLNCHKQTKKHINLLNHQLTVKPV